MVLYFCRPLHTDNNSVNEISRLCDQYKVPFASNVAWPSFLSGFSNGATSTGATRQSEALKSGLSNNVFGPRVWGPELYGVILRCSPVCRAKSVARVF